MTKNARVGRERKQTVQGKVQKIAGVIQEACVCDVFDLWKRKPKGLTFNDSDVVIVKAKGTGGYMAAETFFTCLKADGTFSLKTPNHIAVLRRQRLAKFLQYYKLADDPERYNLVEGVKKWKNKHVEMVKQGELCYIYIP